MEFNYLPSSDSPYSEKKDTNEIINDDELKTENAEPCFAKMVLTNSHFPNSLSESIFEDEKNIIFNFLVNSQSFNHHSDFSGHESIPIYD